MQNYMDILKKEAYEAPEIMVVEVETEGVMTANSNKRKGYDDAFEC